MSQTPPDQPYGQAPQPPYQQGSQPPYQPGGQPPFPQGGQPPYQPGGYGPPTSSVSASDERLWGLLAHLAWIAGSIVTIAPLGPLVVFLIYKDRSPFVRHHAAEALNLWITVYIVMAVSIPLMILASILTHLTARHSVERQNPESATAQTAIMNKLTMYIFPIGVLVFGFFFPIGLLIYWLSNNFWTLMQQRMVYKRIDREEEEKKAAAVEKRTNLAPKPGAKPDTAKKRPGTAPAPGAKPAPNAKAAGAAKKPAPGVKPAPNAKAAGTARPKTGGTPTKPTGSTPANGAASTDGSTDSGLTADRSRNKNTGRKKR